MLGMRPVSPSNSGQYAALTPSNRGCWGCGRTADQPTNQPTNRPVFLAGAKPRAGAAKKPNHQFLQTKQPTKMTRPTNKPTPGKASAPRFSVSISLCSSLAKAWLLERQKNPEAWKGHPLSQTNSVWEIARSSTQVLVFLSNPDQKLDPPDLRV